MYAFHRPQIERCSYEGVVRRRVLKFVDVWFLPSLLYRAQGFLLLAEVNSINSLEGGQLRQSARIMFDMRSVSFVRF